MLCEVCMLVFQGESLFAIRHVDAKLVRMHHQSVDSLYASASALKCPVCVAVWNELLQAYWDRYDSHTTLSTEEKTSRMLDGIKCSELQETDLLGRKFSAFQSTISAIDYNHHMKFNFRKAPTFVLALKIAYSRMTPQYDDAKPDFGFEIYFAAFRHRVNPSAVPLSSNTGSDSTLATAKGWLDECVRSHPECSRGAVPGFMPTRLIRIGDNAEDDCRLVNCGDEQVNEPYITLSHCWGGVQPFSLTEATLPLLIQGLSLTHLLPTFQSAMKVAKILGANYIWIDSLCIIQQQDSKEDWLSESALMGDVYKNSTCNIAATWAKNGHAGLFYDRDPSDFHILVSQPWGSDDTYELHQAERPPPGSLEGPLLQRGWVLQERLLAPRVLHFGQKELFWECNLLESCETFPQGPSYTDWGSRYTDIGDRFKLRMKHLQKLTVIPMSRDTPEIDENLLYWGRLLSEYTKCQITQEEDKLLAISGAAKKLQSITKAQYVAGMWLDKLPQQLVWEMKSPGQGRRAKVYRAPSWSWACLDGVIVTETTQFSRNTNAEVISVNVELASNDPTGLVKAASLTLKGILMTAKLLRTGLKGGDEMLLDNVVVQGNYIPDTNEVAERLHGFILSTSGNGSGDPYTHFVLLQATGIKNGQFRRFGIFKCPGYKLAKLKTTHERASMEWADIQNEEWFDFDHQNSKGIYTIDII